MVKSNKALRKVLILVALFMKDQRRKQPVRWPRRYHSLSRGFISESSILYGVNHTNYKQYVSDYQIMKTGSINGKSSYYLNNKVAFVDMLEGLVEMPTTLAIIKNGQFLLGKYKFKDETALLTYLQDESDRKVVIKPIAGAEGRGVSVVKWEDRHVLMNGKSLSEEEFTTYLTTLDAYFISEFIQQGEFSQALFPDSLNTIRMLTMIDQITQEAFIAGSVFRIGTDESAPTDNFRRRGLSVTIDPDSGRLGRAARIPQDGQVDWYESHPDTGMQLTGEYIPHWETVKEDILRV